jgi:hypothetical protein
MSDPHLVGPQPPISTPANLRRAHRRERDAADLREALGWISGDAWGEKQAMQWWAANRSEVKPEPSSPPEYLLTVEQPAATV